MAGSLGELVVQISTDLTSFNAGLQNANKRLQSTRGEILQMTSQIGRQMTVMGAAITAGMGLAVKSSADFEKQLAEVSTMLSTQSMPMLAKYSKGVKDMAVEFGEGTATLTKGLYDILSASIAPEKAMEVLAVSVKAAKAGITDTGVAADAITTILNSYSLSADRAADISDWLFAIVKRGKTTFAELAPNIGKVASTAAIAGVSLEDLGSTIATLTRAGIRTEESMAAINGVLRTFLGASDEAKEMAEELGFTLDTNVLREKGMMYVMEKLNSLTAEQLRVIFPNIRGLKGMAAALQNAEGYAEDYALMLDRSGLTQEAFNKMTNTLSHEMSKLGQLLLITAVEIGTTLMPAVRSAIESFTKWLEKVRTLIEEHPKLTEAIVKVTAAFGILMVVLGPILIIIPGLYTAFTLLSTAAIALGGGIAIATIALNSFFVIGAAVAGWKLGQWLEENTSLFRGFGDWIEKTGTKFFEWLDKVIEKINQVKSALPWNKTDEWEGSYGRTSASGGASPDESALAPQAGMPVSGLNPEATNAIIAAQNMLNQTLTDNLSNALSQQNTVEAMSLTKRIDQIIASGTLEAAEVEKIEQLKAKIKDKYLKSDVTTKKKQLSFQDQFFTSSLANLASYLAQAGEENKAAAIAAKVINTGLAITNTATGITRAFKDYAWPFSAVVAGIIGAAGALQIATIAGALAEGGEAIGGKAYIVGERGPELFVPPVTGEVIPNNKLGGNNINISLEGAIISSELDVEDLSNKIGENIRRTLRSV